MSVRTHASPSGLGQIRVSRVCLGNLCRSPMAAVTLRAHAAQAGTA